MNGESLLYVNNRLANRETYLEWDKILMGPIRDSVGAEQGGINSGDFYKLYNNEQISSAQDTSLGVEIHGITVCSIGQADDVGLVSNDIHKLECLLFLSELYCRKFNVKLCAEKTKLLVISPKNNREQIELVKLANTLSLDGSHINFVDSAEHVGVIRSTSGNILNIFNRITSHKRALGATMAAGLAQSHRANPAAGLKIQQMYGTPVLMSGLASLVLSNSEIDIINHHVKAKLESIQKLFPRTPAPVVFFLGGSLPGKALLHLRQLNLFGMICRLSGNILNRIAIEKLTAARTTSNSWFLQIRNLCLQYRLPHPMDLIKSPHPKQVFKKLVKSKVIDFWEHHYRMEALSLDSLCYFQPSFMSLTTPHPIWSSAKSNPYEVSKARIQALMLSGRYRTEMLMSHWTHRDGNCLALSCSGMNRPETVEHILVLCPSFADIRSKLFRFWKSATSKMYPELSEIVRCALTNPVKYRCQFILDCSVMPEVIQLVQTHGTSRRDHLLYLTRSFCFAIHRERLKIRGEWKSV